MDIKNKFKYIVLIVLVFSTSVDVLSSEIEVKSSINLEAVLVLTNITYEGFKYQRGYTHPIKSDMYIEFFHLRVMQAAKTTEMLLREGFWISSLALFSQCFSDLPYGKRVKPYPVLMLNEIRDIISSRMSPEVFLDNYFEQIRHFFIQAEFIDFYGKLNDFYKKHCKSVNKAVDELDITNQLEKFFKTKPNKYVLVISSLIPENFNFGGQLTSYDKEKEFYCFKGPDFEGFSRTKYTFTDDIKLENTVVHEFAHSFIKPAVYGSVLKLMEYKNLYNYIKPEMEKLLYLNWTTVIEEHFVRGFEIIYYINVGKEDFAERLLRNYESIGFRFINFIFNALENYRENESEKKFYMAYDEMLNIFGNVKPVKIRFMDKFGFFIRVNRNKRIVIIRVIEGLPFYKVGVRQGDIIYAINGKKIIDFYHMNELINDLNRKEDDEMVNFTFIRDGKIIEKQMHVPFKYRWYFSPN